MDSNPTSVVSSRRKRKPRRGELKRGFQANTEISPEQPDPSCAKSQVYANRRRGCDASPQTPDLCGGPDAAGPRSQTLLLTTGRNRGVDKRERVGDIQRTPERRHWLWPFARVRRTPPRISIGAERKTPPEREHRRGQLKKRVDLSE